MNSAPPPSYEIIELPTSKTVFDHIRSTGIEKIRQKYNSEQIRLEENYKKQVQFLSANQAEEEAEFERSLTTMLEQFQHQQEEKSFLQKLFFL